jgi:pimeloyl-ACP methyl ester carboxylesterase
MDQEMVTGYVDVDNGTELYYEVAGSGQAVVLVHAHSVDRRMWDAQFARLAARFRVIRYDLRGYGLSGMPQEGKDYLHAEDLYKVMKFLGVKQAHIVGLSLGSFVALDFMHLYPEHTLSVSVAAGAIYTDNGEGANEDRARTLPGCDVDTAAPGRQDPVILARIDEWFACLMDCSGAGKEAIRELLWRMVSEWSAWTFRHQEPRCLLGQTLTCDLKNNTPSTPILVIIGSDDSKGSIRSSATLLGLVPSARFAVISGAGHFSNMERPDEFTSELESFFLNRTAGDNW